MSNKQVTGMLIINLHSRKHLISMKLISCVTLSQHKHHFSRVLSSEHVTIASWCCCFLVHLLFHITKTDKVLWTAYGKGSWGTITARHEKGILHGERTYGRKFDGPDFIFCPLSCLHPSTVSDYWSCISYLNKSDFQYSASKPQLLTVSRFFMYEGCLWSLGDTLWKFAWNAQGKKKGYIDAISGSMGQGLCKVGGMYRCRTG